MINEHPIPTMWIRKTYTVGDREDGEGTEEEISVVLYELVSPDYGLFLWPSSKVLAEFVWAQRSRFAGKRVVELGAGVGLPGLVAAKAGAQITLTDQKSGVEILSNLRRNARANSVVCSVLGLDWGCVGDALALVQSEDVPVDVVLGADCLYDSEVFENVFATAYVLMRENPEAVFVTAYQERSARRSRFLLHLLKKWSLRGWWIPRTAFAKGWPGNGCTSVAVWLIWWTGAPHPPAPWNTKDFESTLPSRPQGLQQ